MPPRSRRSRGQAAVGTSPRCAWASQHSSHSLATLVRAIFLRPSLLLAARSSARSSELCSQLHSELSSLLCSLLAHILGALSSLTGFAGTLLPFFVQDVLHSSRSWVGIAITAQYAAATIGLATIGLLSDHYGHRRTLLGVMALNVCALNMQGWVRSIPTLIVARITLGLVSSYGIGLTWVSRQARLFIYLFIFGGSSLRTGSDSPG